MYARLICGNWADIALPFSDSTRQTVRELHLAVKALPGNQSYIGAVDRATGRAMSVSVWDTEEHARFPADALGDLPARLESLGLQVQSSEIMEVTEI